MLVCAQHSQLHLHSEFKDGPGRYTLLTNSLATYSPSPATPPPPPSSQSSSSLPAPWFTAFSPPFSAPAPHSLPPPPPPLSSTPQISAAAAAAFMCSQPPVGKIHRTKPVLSLALLLSLSYIINLVPRRHKKITIIQISVNFCPGERTW